LVAGVLLDLIAELDQQRKRLLQTHGRHLSDLGLATCSLECPGFGCRPFPFGDGRAHPNQPEHSMHIEFGAGSRGPYPHADAGSAPMPIKNISWSPTSTS